MRRMAVRALSCSSSAKLGSNMCWSAKISTTPRTTNNIAVSAMTFERIFMIQDNLPATTRRGAHLRFNLTPGAPDKNATDITEFRMDVTGAVKSSASAHLDGALSQCQQ